MKYIWWIPVVLLLIVMSCEKHDPTNPYDKDYQMDNILDFQATQLTDSSVRLTWRQNEDVLDYYLVEWAPREEHGYINVSHDTLDVSVTSYNVEGISTEYSYKSYICGFNDQNRTNPSSVTFQTTFAPISSFTVELQSTTSAELVWVHNCDYVSEYVLERRIAGGEFDTLTTVGGDIRSWLDTTLVPDQGYEYRIHARSLFNSSNTLTDDVLIVTPVPDDLDIEQVTLSSCLLTWDYTPNGFEDGIRISRRIEDAEWHRIAEISADAVEYTAESLEPGVNYTFRVYAYEGDYDWNYAEVGIEIQSNVDGFVFVPGGTYQMGDTHLAGDGDELPVHAVQISSFCMQATEVSIQDVIGVFNWALVNSLIYCDATTVTNTQGSVQELLDLDDEDCAIAFDGEELVFQANEYAHSADCPCIEITWYGAVAYCYYTSLLSMMTPCYDLTDWSCDFNAGGFRLPTEAEWEYAARGALDNPDYLYAGNDVCENVAWYNGNANGRTHDSNDLLSPVVQLYGGYMFNMSGNVWEWCWDWYGIDYYQTCDNQGTVVDPTGPYSGYYRVIRGGSWHDGAEDCRVSSRYYFYMYNSYNYVGFRMVRNME